MQRARSHWTGAGGAGRRKTLVGAELSAETRLDAVQGAVKGKRTRVTSTTIPRGSIFKTRSLSSTGRSRICVRRSRCPRATGQPCRPRAKNCRTRLRLVKSLSPKEVDAFYTAAEILVEPSISYDSVATEAARQAAAEVSPAAHDHTETRAEDRDGGRCHRQPTCLAKIAAVRNYSCVVTVSKPLCRTSAFRHGVVLGRVEIRRSIAACCRGWRCLAERHSHCSDLSSWHRRRSLRLFSACRVYGGAKYQSTAQRSGSVVVRDSVRDWQPADDSARGPADGIIYRHAQRVDRRFNGPRGLEFVIYAAIASSVAVYGIGPLSQPPDGDGRGLYGRGCERRSAVAMIAYKQQPFILEFGLARDCVRARQAE